MILISGISIKSFRSIRSIKLSDIDNLTAFAGLNNSGKSNVLRALNAYFNGETDEGELLDVDKDFYRPDLNKKKAKRIAIDVSFALPSNFKFRQDLEPVESLLGSKSFTLTKEWRRNVFEPDYYLDGRLLDLTERQKINQFLQLIRFRYIPNRVLPIDVIKKEHQALRDVLIRRLGKKAKVQEKAFETLQETSKLLIQPLAERLIEASPDIGVVKLATPQSWSDLAFAFGYRLGQAGIELKDAEQGSGIQSLLMLETLYLIDLDYVQKFGWQQASIWAIEEPESSLHSSLEARVASFLASLSSKPLGRLQILCTTHSDLVIQYSSKAVIIKKTGQESTVQPYDNPNQALDDLARAGISRWVHPLLHHPLDPVIIVEGKYDSAFLEEAFKYYRPKKKVVVTYLELLDEAKTGGKDDMLNYIKAHSYAIKARLKGSIVIVVLDWDAAGKRHSFEKNFSTHDPYKVIAWPNTALNPNLNKSFHGIERACSDRMIKIIEAKGIPIARTKEGVCSIEGDQYERAKKALYEVVKAGLSANDFTNCKEFIQDILKAAGAF